MMSKQKMKKSSSRSSSKSIHKQKFQTTKEMSQKLGYSNDDNPFGDKQLTKEFIWKKKISKIKRMGQKIENLTEQQAIEKQQKILEEILKIKQQRAQREMENVLFLDQKNSQIIQKNEENFEEWIQKEQNFHKNQEKNRAIIRIQQNRMKFSDNFLRIILIYQRQLEYNIEIEEWLKDPLKRLGNIKEIDYLNEIKEEFSQQQQFENNNEINKKFYGSLILIIEDIIWQLQLAKKKNEIDDEIEEMINEKDINQLEEFEKEVEQTIHQQNEFKIDFDYWQDVLKKVTIKLAYQYFDQILSQIKKELLLLKEEYSPKLLMEDKNTQNEIQYVNVQVENQIIKDQMAVGIHSPYLLEPSEQYSNILTAQQCIEILNQQRAEILQKQILVLLKNMKKSFLIKKREKDQQNLREQKSEELDNLKKFEINQDDNQDQEIARQIDQFKKQFPLNENEEVFNDVAPISNEITWKDKYKPRKPQYFNRVKYGYIWTQYHKSHYDQDNPPPKQIMGYKFNIFYPDLIDKAKVPTYRFENCPENDEFVKIIFSGGPPYEDIAFKILRKEWDIEQRRGFTCVFSRGILHLYFNFRIFKYKK